MKDSGFQPGDEMNIITGMDTGRPGEQIRGAQKLLSLTDEQWDSLVQVGALRVAPIRFGRGTARINIQSQHVLRSLAGTLKSWPQYYLTVIGRVRPGGDADASMHLARSRANSTVAMLQDYGVPGERLRAIAGERPF